MLGRPGISEPVRKKVIAGAWFTCVVCIDLMKHKSSTTLAVSGNSSLTHAPLCPCWANFHGEPTSEKVEVRLTAAEVEAALGARTLTEEHFLSLLSPAAKPYLEEMAQRDGKDLIDIHAAGIRSGK